MTDIEKLPRVQAHEEYVRLQILSGFLNLGNKPKTGLEEYVWNVLGLRKNMAEAKAAQSNLQHILIPLTNPKKRPSLDEAEALVKRLIRHVNRWKFSSKWEVEFGATAEIGCAVNSTEQPWPAQEYGGGQGCSVEFTAHPHSPYQSEETTELG